jgi:hypothetical protein
MHTAQAGTLVENRGEYHGRRRFRKHVERLLYGRGASTSSLQVQDAVIWGALPSVSPAWVGPIDPEHRPMGRMGEPDGGDLHAVCHAPGRLRSPDVTRAWAPSPLIVYE